MASSDNQTKNVLITGGAGFIGSHCCVEVLQAGYDVIVIDNCSNVVKGASGIPESVTRIQKITKKDVKFHEVDLLDIDGIRGVFKQNQIYAVIHTAALKCVPESIKRPLDYYRVNIEGTLNLLEVMKDNAVKNMIFSSSSTVYGLCPVPFVESVQAGVDITNPYGRTTYFTEEILKDVCRQDKSWNIFLLRYFNPVGAHESGLLGENPAGKAQNLMPAVVEAAMGKRSHVNVCGDDFDTVDGTGMRDYPHVVNIAEGHVAALRKMSDDCGIKIYNLGAGKPYSVLEVIAAMEKASGKKIPRVVVNRRFGDRAIAYADPSLALKELGWKATKNLEKSCEDLWRFRTLNPDGYNTPLNNNNATK